MVVTVAPPLGVKAMTPSFPLVGSTSTMSGNPSRAVVTLVTLALPSGVTCTVAPWLQTPLKTMSQSPSAPAEGVSVRGMSGYRCRASLGDCSKSLPNKRYCEMEYVPGGVPKEIRVGADDAERMFVLEAVLVDGLGGLIGSVHDEAAKRLIIATV